MILYRGHKLNDYLKHGGEEPAPCFSENESMARSYGQGKNNLGDSRFANGFLTKAEFNGKLKILNINGIDFKKHYQADPTDFQKEDGIKCKDGPIYVFKIETLVKLHTERA